MSRMTWAGAVRGLTAGLALAGLATALLASRATAQQMTESELLAHIDSLAPLVERASAEAQTMRARIEEEKRQAAAEVTRVDTLRIGDVTVITIPDDRQLAEQLFQEVRLEHFGVVETDVLHAWTFTFQKGRELRPVYVDPSPYVRSVEIDWWQSAEDARAHVRSAVSHAIVSELIGSELSRWSNANHLERPDPHRVYRLMAAQPSIAVEGCLSARMDSCRIALGLGVEDDRAMELWYSAEQLRAAVLALGLHHVAIVQDHSHGCEIAADLDACRRIVEALAGRVGAPLDGSVRSSLVATAIELGGPGAWARLVEYRDAPPIRTLEHVAGVPVEELLSAWHAWVLDNRPVAYAELPTRSFLTLLWIAFFAALATRSTRWRLG